MLKLAQRYTYEALFKRLNELELGYNTGVASALLYSTNNHSFHSITCLQFPGELISWLVK